MIIIYSSFASGHAAELRATEYAATGIREPRPFLRCTEVPREAKPAPSREGRVTGGFHCSVPK